MEIRINYILKEAHLSRLKVLGDGNITDGLRFVVTAWRDAGKPALSGGEIPHPKKGDEKGITRNFRIDDGIVALIAEAGDGNASRGLRRIIEWYDAALRCAWCKRVIGETDAGPRGLDGMCPECEKAFRAQAGVEVHGEKTSALEPIA